MMSVETGAKRVALGLGVSLFLAGCTPKPAAKAEEGPHVVASSPIEAGRYLALVGGCNDCHTPGYNQSGGTMPEAERMTGNPVGYLGPWGVSYAANLRLLAQNITEDGWVKLIKDGKSLPPMPTANMSRMSDQDLRALYQYIRSLGAKGEPEPDNLPPGVAPKTPYEDMRPVDPARAG
jgi:cytochrome c553